MRLLALALMLIASASAQNPEFEAASVKRNTSPSERAGWYRPPESGRFTATNNSLEMLITTAYKLKDFQISGGPPWLRSERYDVTAESPATHVSPEQFRAMLRALLAERFRLASHTERREVPIYVLAPAKSGLKIAALTAIDCSASDAGRLPCGGFYLGPAGMGGRNVSMPFFVDALSNVVDRPVVDRTGFPGKFNVDLEFSPDGVTAFGPGGFTQQGVSAGANTDNKPSIFTALQERIGVQLESQRASTEILVIDQAEKPSEN